MINFFRIILALLLKPIKDLSLKLTMILVLSLILYSNDQAVLYGQNSDLVLLNKYNVKHIPSYLYFNNTLLEKLIEFRYIDSILNMHSDKVIDLNVTYKGKIFREGIYNLIADSSGIIKEKYQPSIYRKTIILISEIPSIPYYISELFIRRPEIVYDTITRYNNNNLISSRKIGFWVEKYTYDDKNNLIEISRDFASNSEDSTMVPLICLEYQNIWRGKYNDSNDLIEVTILWTNGEKEETKYFYNNRRLLKVQYFKPNKKNNSSKIFLYNQGVISSIDILNSKNKRTKKVKYKWKMK